MDISKQMIRQHLHFLFLRYDDMYEESPDELEGYRKDVENMKLNALHFGDLDPLKLAFEHILTHPEIKAIELVESAIGYEEEEVREIIRYAWETIWPDADPIPPGGPPGVRLVDMPPDAWRTHWKG